MLSYINRAFFNCKTHKLIISLILIFVCNNLYAQEYKKIKAQKGDGIYSVLKQNGLPVNQYFDQFIELNRTKLGKENSMIIGRTYRIPIKAEKDTILPIPIITPEKETIPEKEVTPAKETIPVKEVVPVKKVYEIYGNDYNEVAIKSKELSGTVYYLISGHGGPDPGAMAVLNGHQLCEDEYAYDVTLRLARNLTEMGATIYMITRDLDDGIRDTQYLIPDKDEVYFPDRPIPLNQLERLKQCTQAVNSLYAQNKGKFQRMVTIHIDSRDKDENIDVFFYHKKGSKSGEKLANTIKTTFGQRYAMHQPSRGYQGSVSDRNLYVIRKSLPTSVFIEIANINHTRDQKRIIIADNRQAVANWLRDGLIEDYKKASKEKPIIKTNTKKPEIGKAVPIKKNNSTKR